MKKLVLNEICQLLNGYAFKSKQYVDDGIRIIRIANVQKGKIVDDAPCFYPINTKNEIEKYMLSENDLLISLTGNVGRVGLLTKDMLPAALNQRVSCIRILDKDVVFFKYLYYYLQQNTFERDCIKASNGVAQLNLSTKWLENYEIYLPSLEEQQRIVAKIEELFSKLDKGVEELNKIKEQLKIYRQAVLKEVFKNVSSKKIIKELSDLVTSGSRGWAKYYADKGARFVRITDMTRDGIELKSNTMQFLDLPESVEGRRSRLQCNDVLVSITADLGSIALVPSNIGETYINQHIAVIRFTNSKQGEFMAWYLKSEYGQKELLKNKRGAGKLGLGLDDIRNTHVPNVDDSIANSIVGEIEQRLSVCDKIEQTVNESLQKAESLRQSILKKAFEGKLM